MILIPDIKLIRTDTTLDLSQKAEKGMNFINVRGSTLNSRPCRNCSRKQIYRPSILKFLHPSVLNFQNEMFAGSFQKKRGEDADDGDW